ncbi:recQ-mediated genome instability protein 2-like [Saccostrea echinata]|uniref:recQ-mediated genome instability protein 2-like n=1 Tax=Saccostrea echinata TaxID=191078 RepID=UPI002A838AAF|nr:recQ-mediated genome instability protein 2-like [Saccostrea echinata]
MTAVLDYPARKVFVRDICKSIRLRNPENEENERARKKHKEWKVECNGVEFLVTVVWIQGLVTEVNKEEGFLILDDSTGKVKVLGYNNIPFISPSLDIGKYVMIVASMVRSGDLPIVNAIKLQDLSHVRNTEQSWSLEVMDQILHLSSIH